MTSEEREVDAALRRELSSRGCEVSLFWVAGKELSLSCHGRDK